MRLYRCKCGENASWSSIGVASCEGCDLCNTTLEEYAGLHKTPEPHRWSVEWVIDKKTGDRWQERVCVRCYHRERLVESV